RHSTSTAVSKCRHHEQICMYSAPSAPRSSGIACFAIGYEKTPVIACATRRLNGQLRKIMTTASIITSVKNPSSAIFTGESSRPPECCDERRSYATAQAFQVGSRVGRSAWVLSWWCRRQRQWRLAALVGPLGQGAGWWGSRRAAG